MIKWTSLGFSQKLSTIAVTHICTSACFESFLLLSGSRHIPTLTQRNVDCLYLVGDSRRKSTWKALGGRAYNITEAAHPLLRPPARDRGRRELKKKRKKPNTSISWRTQDASACLQCLLCLLFTLPLPISYLWGSCHSLWDSLSCLNLALATWNIPVITAKIFCPWLLCLRSHALFASQLLCKSWTTFFCQVPALS